MNNVSQQLFNLQSFIIEHTNKKVNNNPYRCGTSYLTLHIKDDNINI